MYTMHLLPNVTIQPNLELKTQPKQLLGSLPLVIALPNPRQGYLYRKHGIDYKRDETFWKHIEMVNILIRRGVHENVQGYFRFFFPISTDLRFPKKGLKSLKHVCKPSLG